MPVLNRLPQGGSGKSKLNVFTQSTEPTQKEGIWLKTSIHHEKVVFDQSAYLSGSMLDPLDFPTFNLGGKYELRFFQNGKYIYLNGLSFYIYDMQLQTSTLIKTVSGMTSVKNYCIDKEKNVIYYLGVDSSSYRILEKLNITNGVVTRLLRSYQTTDINYRISSAQGNLGIYNNKIYCVNNGTNNANIYECDLNNLTNTLVFSVGDSDDKYAGLTVLFANEGYVYWVLDNWFLGGRFWYFAILSLATGTKTDRLISFNVTEGASETNSKNEVKLWGYEVVANDVYFFLGKRKYTNGTSLYDSVDLVRTRLTTPSSFSALTTIYSYGSLSTNASDGKAENLIYDSVNNFILDVGYYQGFRATHGYALTSKQYSDKSVIVVRNSTNIGGTYYTELVSADGNIEAIYNGRLCTGFIDVFYYDGSLKSIETYYGNGTSWVKIK